MSSEAETQKEEGKEKVAYQTFVFSSTPPKELRDKKQNVFCNVLNGREMTTVQWYMGNMGEVLEEALSLLAEISCDWDGADTKAEEFLKKLGEDQRLSEAQEAYDDSLYGVEED